MKRETIIAISALVLVGVSVSLFVHYKNLPARKEVMTKQSSIFDGTYSILGKDIVLKDNVYQHGAGDTVAMTRYFGNEKEVDMNADGVMDKVFLLVQERNDNRSQYFVTGIVSDNGKTKTIKARSLGVSIAPQAIGFEDEGIIAVNFSNAGQSLSETTGETLRLKYNIQENAFDIMVSMQNKIVRFDSMSLPMKTWHWERAVSPTGVVTSAKTDIFTVTFTPDGKFSLKTDCNGGGGEYSTSKSKITLKNMISTMMFCDGSQEDFYRDILSRATDFAFTTEGQLVLFTPKQEEMYFK